MRTLDELRKLDRFPMDRESKINRVDGLIELCVDRVTKRSIVVELGTGSGVSAETFAHFAIAVVTVDLNDCQPDCPNVTKLCGDSVAWATAFADESLDLVYLDSDHGYDHVKAEIEAWWPKVKPDGYLAGHDFQADPGVEVIRAVCERFDFPDMVYSDSSWIVRKHG